MWRHPYIAALGGLIVLGLAAAPVIGLRTSMPSITIIPASANARVGYYQVTNAFGPGAPGTLQVVVPAAEQPAALSALAHTIGVAGVVPGPTNAGYTLDQSCRPPDHPPPPLAPPSSGIRNPCPPAASSAARPRRTSTSNTPWPPERHWCSDSWPPWASCCCSSRSAPPSSPPPGSP